MLQIITEKFYKPGERYETLHRAVFYTNYRMLMRAERIETPIGVLLPTAGLEGLAAMTCEMLEKIEKRPDGHKPGVMISTGGASLLNDFAAVTAFALDITCTPDPDLTRRLLATERPSLGVQSVPSQFIKHIFDRQIISKEGDGPALAQFVTQLVGLERKRFEAAMRSIRQYITGLHRIADNISLAYTQLVMSIESLAQEFDGHVADWSDYEHRKREKIDTALEGAPTEIGDKVRNAVLANEHVAAARRFRDFALSHLAPSFFREETAQTAGPISRGDLTVALRQAYAIRSRYVHTLQEIPSQLTVGSMPEMVEERDRPVLSVAGLARVARHIIMQFVARGPFVDREEFDYHHSLPNIVTMRLAPEYWIANTGGFTYQHGPLKLSALISQITSAVLLRTSNAKITDIRPVLALVEEMMPGLQNPKQRLPLLTLYFLFHQWAGLDFSREQWPALFEKYKSDFDHPSIESFVAHILTGDQTEWTLEQFEELYREYFKTRHRARVTNIGCVLEAALSLYVAEINRRAGNEVRARELVALAVEAHPSHTGLRGFEAALPSEPLPEIVWEKILLPPPRPKAAPPSEEKPKDA
jgi:hypothetical protein